jgi:hypothetical protein
MRIFAIDVGRREVLMDTVHLTLYFILGVEVYLLHIFYPNTETGNMRRSNVVAPFCVK